MCQDLSSPKRGTEDLIVNDCSLTYPTTVFVVSSDEYTPLLRGQIEDLATTLVTVSENSLFSVQSKIKYHECVQPLNEARSKLNQDFNGALAKYMEASGKIDEAIDAASLKWRVVHLYGIPHMLYLLICLASLVYVYIWSTRLSPSMIVTLWVPIWSPVLGALGGIARGLWSLWYRVNRRSLRKVWLTWFIVAPFVGAILGVLMYLAFLAGYVATTQSTEVKGEAFPMLLSLLAGFNWEWANQTLSRIVKALGGTSEA